MSRFSILVEMEVLAAQARWHRSSPAETDANDHASAACYRRSEDILVVTVVIPEFKICDVQRHVFFADLMECTDNATFENRPEAFDGLSVLEF
jgi:hypothetical protein